MDAQSAVTVALQWHWQYSPWSFRAPLSDEIGAIAQRFVFDAGDHEVIVEVKRRVRDGQ